MSGLLLAVIVLFIVPLLLGTLWNRIWQIFHIAKIEKTSVPGNYLPGVFLMLCFFEGIVIISMKMDMPFSKVVFVVSVLFLLLCGIACILCQKELKILLLPKSESGKETDTPTEKKRKIWILFFLLVFFLQVLLVIHFAPVTGDDNTMEIVQTTLATDSIGMYNPLTGQPYETGLTFQGKLLSLPVFYAYMIQIFSMNPAMFIYGVIPIWALFMTYQVYSIMGDELFHHKGGEQSKQLFLFFYSTLLLFGGFLFTTPGYQLLYGGWKGETLVVTVILPYLLCMGLHWSKEKHMTILQGILAAVTVIPLMRWRKGIVYIALMVGIILLTGVCMKIRNRIGIKRTDTEESYKS